MLSEVYSWFTEGFETADLKETKALIDELSHNHINAELSRSAHNAKR
jgi:hypothetical protein